MRTCRKTRHGATLARRPVHVHGKAPWWLPDASLVSDPATTAGKLPMNYDDFGFDIPQPPFSPDDALVRLRRELRDVGLAERADAFERRGQPLVRATVADDGLRVGLVKRPARTPEWTDKTITSSAALRDFITHAKRELERWNDRDD